VFDLEITGRGSHAAQPQKSVDPVMIAVQIAQAWQTIISRNTDPNDSAVLSVTQIHAGNATNIVPDTAYLNGTVRTFSADVIVSRMKALASGIASGFGANVLFRFKRNYPPLMNHADETDLAIDVVRRIVGEEYVNTNVSPTMAAEDFSFML
jgi:amidohydrolase